MLGYEQMRIGGRLYTDGGLLGALPLAAAVELGAERIVAINAMPAMPSVAVSAFVKAVQAIAPGAAEHGREQKSGVGATPAPDIRVIAPRAPLGPLRKAVFWDRHAVERWIEQGEADARRAVLE